MNLNNLTELGLSQGQIQVYSAVLELGISTLGRIQEKTGIERRNIYDILNKLIEKGLITYTVEKGKKTFQCTHPNKVDLEIKNKQEALKELKAQIPSMTALFESVKPDIRAEVFRGNEAMKALLEDMLNYKETYWIGGNAGVESTQLKNWFKHWMDRRVKKKRMMNDLVDYGTYLEDLRPGDIKTHKKNYYKYCALPKELVSPMVIVIFGNKVAQILWSRKSFAFVMESKQIKNSFMRYFNYFWQEPW
ncbi:TrmB family transcriptional regulator [Thermoproteota archaeon]